MSHAAPARGSGSLPGKPARGERRLDANDAYFWFLCAGLAGYALFGKGFAHIGVAPLLIGEVLLAFGLLALLRFGLSLVLVARLPALLLLVLMCWVLVRTLPNIAIYGLNALRDSVIVVYGAFAFIVIALLLERPERLRWILDAYGKLTWLYGIAGGVLSYLTVLQLRGVIPAWPSSGVPLINVRPGEVAVHLSGAAVFVLLGFRRMHPLWVVTLIVSIAMVTPSRGAMLSCFLPIMFAAVVGGMFRYVTRAFVAAGLLFAISHFAELEIRLPGERSVGASQVMHNVESIIGRSEASNLDGTKTWRLRWWRAIHDYTFEGDYFWDGKGFGVNLAEADGFVVGAEAGGPPLRSPHNAHMTILARSGVPGICLWTATILAWLGMMLKNMVLARRRGDVVWARLFLWIVCYASSVLIDASFDVVLEGPMLGIWYWCLFGLGVAASLIYSAGLNADATVGPGSSRPPAGRFDVPRM